ncbi:DUF3368 domain-containing protein [Candidatus Woesearchaeota archaeon]|nr:DUF3368 domain-containing protein [Candidatus Woesearchaeota archaeon]
MIVSDSSPIINFGRHGMLDILRRCFKKVLISDSVYREVMQKKESPESVDLENAIKSKWISVEKMRVMEQLGTKNLGQGEKESISLASKYKLILLIDDDSAKKYAAIFGVEAHGTLYAIYLAYSKKSIDKAEAASLLNRMIEAGFYISPEVKSRFVELLNKR